MPRPTPFPLSMLAWGLAVLPAASMADEVTRLDAIQVQGEGLDSYRALGASLATPGSAQEASALDTPASVSVYNAQLLQDQQARLLSEVLRNDASVGDSYAPIGYYENFQVRGFTLDAANSYKINGLSIAGEQNVALENKEQVEVLKGLSGLQSGVSAPGGAINYVTKRPRDVRSVTLSGDEQGGRYLATDLGGWFGSERQFGLRANLAHEDLRSYVDHADGQRDFASLAFDWNISDDATLQLDAEYQTREQRSVPGYQLLGGSALPHGVSPHDLLGYQGWSNPVGMDSLNLNGRFEYRFNDQWTASLSAARSRVVIDDYSAFAWGCYGAASCAADAVPNYFGAEGDYDIYDYRNPDDTRRNDQAQAALRGEFNGWGLRHELSLGLDALRRTVDGSEAVNEWVGSGNIYTGNAQYAPYAGSVGHSYRHLDSRQYAVFLSDRVHLNDRWQLVLGGREVRLNERAYTASGLTRHTEQWQFLPDVALIFQPRPDISLYTRYSEGLASGGEASWFTSNAGETLAPTTSRQLEAGIKRDWQRLSLSATLFQLRQAFQYSRPNGDGSFTYVQQGQQKNTGLELSAIGRATERLQLTASAAAIHAEVEGSGTAAYDEHQALNVPKWRASLFADYSVPGLEGLALLGGAQYSASKYANLAGTVKVGDYTVFNAGARYTTRIEGYETVLRLMVDNLFDKRYWRDAGEYLGDGYLFQGAPRTARLSATVNF